MAGEWIPMRVDLAEDPAVIFVAKQLQIPKPHVVGLLHTLWSWASQQSVDGRMLGITTGDVDAKVGHDGFAAALINVPKPRWLLERKSGITVPRFDHWLSQGAKRRSLTNRRVSQYRKRKCNAASVTKALPEDRTGQDRTGQGSTPHTPRPVFDARKATAEAFDDLAHGAEPHGKPNPTAIDRALIDRFGDATRIGPGRRKADYLVQEKGYTETDVLWVIGESKANGESPSRWGHMLADRVRAEREPQRRPRLSIVDQIAAEGKGE